MNQVQTNETTTHVNPDVASGASINTKPVTAAKAKAKVAAPVEAIKAPKAAKAVAAEKPSSLTSWWAGLARWPVNACTIDGIDFAAAGPAPCDYDIARAVAFIGTGKGGRGSRKLIGAATALRPNNTQYTLNACTDAQWVAIGMTGTRRDVMSNVVSDMVSCGYVRKLAKVQNQGFNVEVTPAGEKRWAEFVRQNPQYDIPNPYKAAAEKAAAAEAKKLEAKAKAAATRAAKGKVDHIAPEMASGGRSKVTDEVLPVEGYQGSGQTENVPTAL